MIIYFNKKKNLFYELSLTLSSFFLTPPLFTLPPSRALPETSFFDYKTFNLDVKLKRNGFSNRVERIETYLRRFAAKFFIISTFLPSKIFFSTQKKNFWEYFVLFSRKGKSRSQKNFCHCRSC